MKKSQSSSQVATKKDLKVLERKLENSFKNKLKDSELALMIRIEDRVQKTEENITELIKETNNNLLTKIDGIAKGLDDMRTENAFGSKQIEELRERVTKLESPQAA